MGNHANNIQPSLVTNLVVPLGISYITFQAIGYLIEVKREDSKAEKHIGIFATYLLFFPKIFSGPIEPAEEFLPQLRKKHVFDYDEIMMGLKRILWGLFLKLVVANRLAIYTDTVFGNYNHYSGTTILIAALLFTIQLFADFAGYSEIAIGSAQILGYKLMENFNAPLVAKSVTEFWRRWHISLSSWVNKYIYQPLVFNYRQWNEWAVVVAVFLSFLIVGFWHGASWNFIFFGFLQGFIVLLEFLTRKWRKKWTPKIHHRLNTILGVCYTFGYFCLSSIFFRVSNLSDGLQMIKKIFTNAGTIYYENPSMILFSLLAITILLSIEIKRAYFNATFSFFNNSRWLIRDLSCAFLVIVILLMGVFDGKQFIYFKF